MGIGLGCQGGPGLPSMANCSEIFRRSEPPTNPMATFFRSSDRSSSIAGDALYTIADKRHHCQENGAQTKHIPTWRAGVRVPSTSNNTSLLIGLSAKVFGAILGETMVAGARERETSDTFPIGNLIPRRPRSFSHRRAASRG